jgi:DNA-3-methyladenine glycosylase II
MRRDSILRHVIRRVGPCRLGADHHPDHLTALAASIISQQLSGKAADTIFGRFLALFPGHAIPDAASMVGLSEASLRAVGLSRQKAMSLKDLCVRIERRELALEGIDALPDEAVIESLTTVKGIGRWTAEMFLLFRLHRPDVLPVADLGIVTGVQKLYGLRKRPDAKRLLAIGEAWRPYRSVACWYVWRVHS